MKNIEINNKQKENLLEMCRILFPEYPDLQFGVKEKHNWSKEYLVFGLTGNEPIIHWFEFCIFYLIDKIFNEDQKEAYLSNKDFYKGGLSFGDEHPVDILYEQFKKLK